GMEHLGPEPVVDRLDLAAGPQAELGTVVRLGQPVAGADPGTGGGEPGLADPHQPVRRTAHLGAWYACRPRDVERPVGADDVRLAGPSGELDHHEDGGVAGQSG